MGKVLTIGEPMGMFIASAEGKLKDVKHFERYVAGAEMNVSVGVSRLGHDISYITEVGQDPFGESVLDFLEAEGIDTSNVKVNPTLPTGFLLKSKDSENDPEVVYFRKGSAASKMGPEKAAAVEFGGVDIFHVTGILMALNDGTFELVKSLILKAREQGTVITFDPNLRPSLWASRELMVSRLNEIAGLADYVLPGIGEGEVLAGTSNQEEIADFYLEKGAKAAIIKTGPAGAFAKWRTDQGYEQVFVPGFKLKQVVDTVGAGDGFAAGVLTGILEGLSMEQILERANAIGAIQVSHISDNENLPTPARLADFIAYRM